MGNPLDMLDLCDCKKGGVSKKMWALNLWGNINKDEAKIRNTSGGVEQTKLMSSI